MSVNISVKFQHCFQFFVSVIVICTSQKLYSRLKSFHFFMQSWVSVIIQLARSQFQEQARRKLFIFLLKASCCMTQEFILVSTIYFFSKNFFQFEEFIYSLLLCFIFLLILYSEAVVQRFSVKKVFLEILQNTNKLNDKHIWATASGKYCEKCKLRSY